MDKTILIIEDDRMIVRFLKMALETKGYEVKVAKNGVNGIDDFLNIKPDMILLDLGLPDIDGLDVIDTIREKSDVPIIVVSAREKSKEKVSALDAGADDYLTKPFNIEELMARIRVAFRKEKNSVAEGEKIFTYKGITIDYAKHTVALHGEEIHFTPIEFDLLSLLSKNQGKVLTHSFIQDKIWGYQSEDDYQSLRVFIASIRKKLTKDEKQPFIKTEIGVGYRFNED